MTMFTVRIFVAILISGTPAAVNQLVLTQLYNPAGTAHTLAMFLALQCGSSARDLVSLTVLTDLIKIFVCLCCLRELSLFCVSLRLTKGRRTLAAIALCIVGEQ